MRTKIISVGIVLAMVFVGLSVMSFTAPAEDVTKPFVDKSSGYPSSGVVIDQIGENCADYYLVYSSNPKAQIFVPSISGELKSVDVALSRESLQTVNVLCEIRPAAGYVPGSTGSQMATATGTFTLDYYQGIGNQQWCNIEFSTPPVLSAGQPYAIVMIYFTEEYNWDCIGDYAVADGFHSIDDGNTWTPNSFESFGFKTYMDNGQSGLKKVAWSPDGSSAFAVTGANAEVWQYDRETGSWSGFGNPDPTVVFYDITYDSTYGLYWLVGQDTSNQFPISYMFDGTNFFDQGTFGTTGKFYSVAPAAGMNSCYFIAVGVSNSGNPLAVWYTTGSSYIPISTGWRGGSECLNSVTWNYDTGASPYHYAVGEDSSGFGMIYRFFVGSSTATYLYNTIGAGSKMEPSMVISWNPQAQTSNEYNYALIGNGYNSGHGNVYKFSGGINPSVISTRTVPINDISWHPDGSKAVLVGGDSGTGVIYHHFMGHNDVTDMSTELSGSPDVFYGVAVKGPNSPSSAIVIGADGSVADYVDASDGSSRIIANAAYPHLYWIGFNDTSQNSMLEQPVSPDGWYEFSMAGNYSLGWTNCEVEIQAWYDMGAVGDLSVYPLETEGNRCLAFTLTYDVNTGTYSLSWPAPLEYAIGIASDTNLGGLAGEEVHELRFEIYLGPQTRNATGDGFGSGDVDTDNLKNNALLDANSWDFSISLRDASFADAAEIMYSEFGVDKVVSVSVTGNPAGNAPPGSESVALSNPSQITYSSNADYWVNVSIPHLYLNGDTGSTEWIDANNVNVSNSNFLSDSTYSDINGFDWPNGRPMQGSEIDWCVWGNSTTATEMPAPGNGTVAFGVWGSEYNNAITTTELNWWITVPAATEEGVYWAYITITIEAEG